MEKKIHLFFILGIFAFLLVGYGIFSSPLNMGSLGVDNVVDESDENVWYVDGVKFLVDPSKIIGGGPPKDGIPSIDKPKFVSQSEAESWINDKELVMAIDYKGVKRVYPLQILVYHEIVNDFIAGDPILITYCPLCGSGIAFERTIDGEAVEFGTSGKLYNSNLVMYDRKTDSYWNQIGGRGISGEMAGRELKLVPLFTVTWRDWKKMNEDAEVLSRDTGFKRDYGFDPYGNYYLDKRLVFDVEASDDRMHPKEPVYGLRVNEVYKAYKVSDLAKLKTIHDIVDGVSITIKMDDVGLISITRNDDGNELVAEYNFWFSWYAFHTETLVYTP